MHRSERLLEWIGNSRKDLLKLPFEVKKLFGYALHFAQRGEQHPAAKVLKGFGGAGVLEVIESDVAGTYRAVYTVKRRFSSCTVSKRRAKAGLQRRKKTWI